MQATLDQQTVLGRAMTFLGENGIPAEFGTQVEGVVSFLPGVQLVNGRIIFSGDVDVANVLHEAGHLALLDEAKRARATGTVNGQPEPAVIAWAHAAAIKAGIGDIMPCGTAAPSVAEREQVRNALQGGTYEGIRALADRGFIRSTAQFPTMDRWLA